MSPPPTISRRDHGARRRRRSGADRRGAVYRSSQALQAAATRRRPMTISGNQLVDPRPGRAVVGSARHAGPRLDGKRMRSAICASAGEDAPGRVSTPSDARKPARRRSRRLGDAATDAGAQLCRPGGGEAVYDRAARARAPARACRCDQAAQRIAEEDLAAPDRPASARASRHLPVLDQFAPQHAVQNTRRQAAASAASPPRRTKMLLRLPSVSSPRSFRKITSSQPMRGAPASRRARASSSCGAASRSPLCTRCGEIA